MIEILSIILVKIGDAFIGSLTGKVTDAIWAKLQGDPAKKALQKAIGSTIQKYATSGGLRIELAQPLLVKDGFLTDPDVAAELAQLVRFEHAPNAELIGTSWKKSMDYPPPWCNFTREASYLLDLLRNELRGTDVFRPIFDAQSLDAIASNSSLTATALQHIEQQIADLTQLMTGHMSELTASFARAAPDIASQIYDFTNIINEKTHSFVGRQLVFDAFKRFTDRHPRGYFIIRGDPGIGKSALAAQMVKTHGYIHHFNNRSEHINDAETFLGNMCAQLIAAYGLKYTTLPQDARKNAGFLQKLLNEVSAQLGSQGKTILVVDGLDEVDMPVPSPGTNILYLPRLLPEGIYIVTTTRKIQLSLKIECEYETLDLEHNSEGNIADIQAYVQQAVGAPGIQAYIAAHGIDNEKFVAHMVEKSEGNFIYLRYVLPEIEQGAYKDLDLAAIPSGLQNYYEDHWVRMRGSEAEREAWLNYKLPVVMALVVVNEPVSLDLLAQFSGVPSKPRILDVLEQWEQFLHKVRVPYQGRLETRYSIYHASFHDFIARKEEVEQEIGVSQQAANEKIADVLLTQLGMDKE